MVAGNANGLLNHGGDETFATTGPPTVDEESTASPAQTTATLQAQINPHGFDTTYRFEYGTSTSYGSTAPVLVADIGAGMSDVPVSVELTGLQAGATYHYRVVAVSSAGTAAGVDQTVTTVPPALIDSVTATGITSNGATLRAQINPLGNNTTYRFEYGTSTSYGTSVPIPDGDVGAGSSDQAVAQQVSGLNANTTYHVRVIAQNALGTARSADYTFVYDTSGGGLPDGREYELVTPVQKNGSLIGDTAFFSPMPEVAADGSRVMAFTIQCFAGAEACNADSPTQTVGSPYAFTRTSSGWEASALSPSATQLEVSSSVGYSADDGTALFAAPPSPDSGSENLFARGVDGSLVDVGPDQGLALRATPDLSHIVMESASSVFEYVVGSGGSQPLLVGVSGGEGSTDLISACGTRLGGGQAAGSFVAAPGMLSADGRTVYFTASACGSGSGANSGVPVPANALYARIDEARTVLISGHAPEPECGATCQGSAPAAARFLGASEDGSKGFFVSAQQLTDAASEGSDNLYAYDFSAPGGHQLVDASAGDTSGNGPDVRGVMAVSADGSHVYFVAGGVLTQAGNEQGQTAQGDANNLYVFERDASYPEGRVAFITTLPNADSNEWGESWGEGRLTNVTPDGRFLVFLSHGRLTADDSSVSSAKQVFRYDAQTGALVRISIGDEGFNDNGNSSTPTPCSVTINVCSEDARLAHPAIESLTSARRGPTISDDGEYVFFQSPVGLTPQALNDVQIATAEAGSSSVTAYAQNVYEWDAGHVYLISDGRDVSVNKGSAFLCESQGSSVCLLGADSSGANVFFSTADQLVPQDTDTELDYYDARICTTSSPCIAPLVAPATCQGEACHGSPVPAPLAPDAASAVFSGPGNLAPPPSSSVVKAKVKHKPKPRKKARARRRHQSRAAGRHQGRANSKARGK